VVMSPFSLPVMQMGFPKYLELLFEQPELFQRLMAVNQTFCIEWANAQLAAGATAITYFDPVSSTTNIAREQYLQTGLPIAKATLAGIKGPVATHFASGRCLPLVDDVATTGSAVVSSSYLEDLATTKRACKGKLTVLGNLNGIEMRRWSPQQAEQAVKNAIAAAAPGGGYILADNHGEIPWQVPDEVITAISDAVHHWGRYPLDWLEQHE
jgi:uroporphyrinogen decarboxylase